MKKTAVSRFRIAETAATASRETASSPRAFSGRRERRDAHAEKS
jgi:hypothetical protein